LRALAARAPTRLDFGGGWTDVPPYSEQEGGFVCNVAIASHATVHITALEDARTASRFLAQRGGDTALAEAAATRLGVGGIALELKSHFPLGAGLGGSSAAGVAVAGALAAWKGEALDRSALAERSRQVEVDDLHVPGGRQDHYAAAYGGALALTFGTTTDVRPLPLSHALRDALEQRCIVAYTGQSRISGDTITAVLDAYRRREPGVLHALERMKTLAAQMADALSCENIDDLGALVGEHWVHQRALHPAIPTPLIDEILERARRAGAIGGKALGASGGGCVLMVARDDRVDAVRAAVGPLAMLQPVVVDTSGFTWSEEA
jgi:D-glycero-alpha-D-manno-heptose-7-phosphate kinase